MTEYDKAHVEDLICGTGSWFTAKLFRLIANADESNRARLYKGFPKEVDTVCMFLNGKPFNEQD